MKEILHPEKVHDIILKSGKINSNKAKLYKPHDDWYWCDTISEYVYCVRNNITSFPKCKNKVCNEIRTWTRSIKTGYSNTCSWKCDYEHKKQSTKTQEITKEDIPTLYKSDNKIDQSKTLAFHLPNNHWAKTFSEWVYCMNNNVLSQPSCSCGSPLRYHGSSGYSKKFCSYECSNSSKITKSKMTASRRANGGWRSEDEISDYSVYTSLIEFFTSKQKIYNLPNVENRGKCGVEGAYQLDHIISKKEGFKRSILPHIIGDIKNLQIIPWEQNQKKRDQCYSIIEYCNHIAT